MKWKAFTLYYGFNKEIRKVNRIKLTFDTFPKYYWEESAGKELNEFFRLLKADKIQQYTKVIDEVIVEVCEHFKSILGIPVSTTEDEVFNKPYQKFLRHKWNEEEVSLIMQSYINDKSAPRRSVTKLFDLILQPEKKNI